MCGAFFVQVVTNSFKYSSSWNPQGNFHGISSGNFQTWQGHRLIKKKLMIVTWDISIQHPLAQPRKLFQNRNRKIHCYLRNKLKHFHWILRVSNLETHPKISWLQSTSYPLPSPTFLRKTYVLCPPDILNKHHQFRMYQTTKSYHVFSPDWSAINSLHGNSWGIFQPC